MDNVDTEAMLGEMIQEPWIAGTVIFPKVENGEGGRDDEGTVTRIGIVSVPGLPCCVETVYYQYKNRNCSVRFPFRAKDADIVSAWIEKQEYGKCKIAVYRSYVGLSQVRNDYAHSNHETHEDVHASAVGYVNKSFIDRCKGIESYEHI